MLEVNRGHWCISCHYVLDWNFDEDRSAIRTSYGPENLSRRRRLAISLTHLARKPGAWRRSCASSASTAAWCSTTCA